MAGLPSAITGHKEIVWGQKRWDPVRCPLQPAAADCHLSVPTDWRGPCAGRRVSMRCRQQSWLTTLLQLALCWSHSPTAAWARSHSTSKCRGARENVVCLGIPNLPGKVGWMPWGWVLSCRFGCLVRGGRHKHLSHFSVPGAGVGWKAEAVKCYSLQCCFVTPCPTPPAAAPQPPGLC